MWFTGSEAVGTSMALDGWTWLVVAANAVLFVVAVAAAAVLLGRRGGDAGAEVATWYERASELTRDVARVAETVERPAEPDRAARRLLPLSGRLRRHVREAPRTVDPEVHQDLFRLATRCQQVAVEHRPVGAGASLEERLERLAEDAVAVEARIPPD